MRMISIGDNSHETTFPTLSEKIRKAVYEIVICAYLNLVLY